MIIKESTWPITWHRGNISCYFMSQQAIEIWEHRVFHWLSSFPFVTNVLAIVIWLIRGYNKCFCTDEHCPWVWNWRGISVQGMFRPRWDSWCRRSLKCVVGGQWRSVERSHTLRTDEKRPSQGVGKLVPQMSEANRDFKQVSDVSRLSFRKLLWQHIGGCSLPSL